MISDGLNKQSEILLTRTSRVLEIFEAREHIQIFTDADLYNGKILGLHTLQLKNNSGGSNI